MKKLLVGILFLMFALAVPAQEPEQANAHPSPTDKRELAQIEKQKKRAAEEANSEARYQIQSAVPRGVTVTVQDDSVTLYGYVNSQQQLVRAIQVADYYASGREVRSNIQIGGGPW